MKRLTTDTPKDNFIDPLMNYVYSRDGWAYIRHDGEHADVPLTQWARKQCVLRGCRDYLTETPEESDELICGCMMDSPDCPIALAYCFASQACHLRSRLKLYEDILFSADGAELITLDMLQKQRTEMKNDPLTLEELRKMHLKPVWVERQDFGVSQFAIVRDAKGPNFVSFSVAYGVARLPCSVYGRNWMAYRRKPEGRITDEA